MRIEEEVINGDKGMGNIGRNLMKDKGIEESSEKVGDEIDVKIENEKIGWNVRNGKGGSRRNIGREIEKKERKGDEEKKEKKEKKVDRKEKKKEKEELIYFKEKRREGRKIWGLILNEMLRERNEIIIIEMKEIILKIILKKEGRLDEYVNVV